MTTLFKIEGKLVKLLVNGPKSVGYANFGGTYMYNDTKVITVQSDSYITDRNSLPRGLIKIF